MSSHPTPALTPRELERDLEAYFYRRVRAVGGMPIKMIPTHAGIPDRLVLLPHGQIFLVELKTNTGTLSPIQRHWHECARQIGVHVKVLYGKGQISEWVAEVLEDQWLAESEARDKDQRSKDHATAKKVKA